MEEFQEDLKTAVIWIKVFSAGAIFLLAMVVFPLSWTIPGIIAILISAIIVRDSAKIPLSRFRGLNH